MLNINDANKLLKDFGFGINNVEPIIFSSENGIKLFATYKTMYGHLSRTIEFDDDQELKNFLIKYCFYRRKNKDEKMEVEFDDYIVESPNIKFIYSGIEVTPENVNSIDKIKEEEIHEVEQEEIDTTEEDNIKLFDKIVEQIMDYKDEIDKVELKLEQTISDYIQVLKDYNTKFNIDEKIYTPKIKHTDMDIYNNRINILKLDINNSKNEVGFDVFIKKLVQIYQDFQNDENYLENIYLNYFYNTEIEKINEKNRIYDEYIEFNSKKKLFKKSVSIEEYNEEHKKEIFEVDKNTIVANHEMEVNNSLIELKNSSLKELKIIYGITSIEKKVNEPVVEITYDDEYKINSLNSYFMGLSVDERNCALLLNSPLKDIFSDIYLNNYTSAIEVENNEKLNLKIKEIYDRLSSIDNYSLTRKYLKFLKLDSIEELIESLLMMKERFNIKNFESTFDSKIRYKAGNLIETNYITASLSTKFPINGVGSNDYYISTIKNDYPIIFSPYVLYFNEEDELCCDKNEDIIIIDTNKYENIDNNKEMIVYNYMLKLKNRKYKVELFNKKSYKEINLKPVGYKYE